MNPKTLSIIGLICLTISQFLLAQGFDFLQAQQPIDFAHWLMMMGAILMLAFSFIFPKGVISSVATFLTILGVIAHIGMCTIDFLLWSYGDDYESRNAIIGQLMNTPSIQIPFMIIGPALLYAGVATYAWQFIKSHTLAAMITLVGSGIIGVGQTMVENRLFIVCGCVVFSVGLLMLVFRKED